MTSGTSYTLTGDVNNAGLTDAKSMVVTVGAPAKAVEPYAQYAIGSLAADDFSSFEITFTSNDLSSVPLVITWKDNDGNSFSSTKNLNLRTNGGSGATGTVSGSSGSSSASVTAVTTGSSSTRTNSGFSGGPPGGGSIFGLWGQPGRRSQFLLSCHCRRDYHHSRHRGLDKAEMDRCKTEETLRGPVMNGIPLIRLSDVSKVYHLESGDFTALNHISLDISGRRICCAHGTFRFR